MSAWTTLIERSSLAIGSAWDLITHPLVGGSGTTYNTGATASLNDTSMQVVAVDAPIAVAVKDAPTSAIPSASSLIATANDAGLLIEVTTARELLI